MLLNRSSFQVCVPAPRSVTGSLVLEWCALASAGPGELPEAPECL